MGAFLSAIASGLKIAAIALGWLKQNSDQNVGKQLQAAADDDATIKEASDAQKTDSSVAGVSGSELDDELRASTER